MQNQELEAAKEAVNVGERAHYRDPRMQPAANKPSDEEVAKHNLTHTPYQGWCEHCIAHRARPDRHERTDEARTGKMPTISFDLCLCYTKALGEGELEADGVSSPWIVMADSQTGYVGCCPLKSKGQIKLATCEIMAFTQNIGHHEVCFLTDNEPTTRQILRCLLNARHALGLPTRIITSKVADHSNALAENTVNRVRGLAGTLMDQLQTKLGLKSGTSNPLWSWAARHSSWLLNRYRPVRGATPFELVHGKVYRGSLALFGEPIYAFVKTALKGHAKWHKALFLGKTEGQDSFSVYDGSRILLTKSIRRIGQSWGLSLAYFKEFSCPSFDYQTSFGSRIIPTKREALASPVAASLIPLESIVVKKRDPEAEAVAKKATEESKEENELERMKRFDDPGKAVIVHYEDDDTLDSAPLEHPMENIENTPVENKTLVQEESEKSKGDVLEVDDDTPLENLKVPLSTQIRFRGTSSASGVQQPASLPAGALASSPTSTRSAEGGDEEHVAKKLKGSPAKKLKIGQVKEEMEACIRTVRFGNLEFYTVDEPEVDGEDINSNLFSDSFCHEEPSAIPDCLWADGVEKPGEPDRNVDAVAEQVELDRLAKMEVLRAADQPDDQYIQKNLTTRFVFDWRLKNYDQKTKRWLRRARLVAREYAFEEGKRDGVFSPASSSHLLRLLPSLYLNKMSELAQMDKPNTYDYLLGSLDIKDAFLQVEQKEPLRVKLGKGHGNHDYIVLRNLPGQRLGARAWFDYLSDYLKQEAGFQHCPLNPCLARNEKMTLLVHVDDVMLMGEKAYVQDVFLPLLKKKFELNCELLKDVGDSISFLKRTYTRVDDGIVVKPGNYIPKMLEAFEEHFGMVRVQQIPADSGIQVQDNSQELNGSDATVYRSITGMALYLAQERYDISYCVKELSSKMVKPTVLSLQRLKKLLGYLRGTQHYALKLSIPTPGVGKLVHSECGYVLESYSDSDWSGHKAHRRSTSASLHFLNGNLRFGTSRTQKVVSLSSAEAELHSLVGACADGIYLRGCLEFLLNVEVHHVALVDNSACKSLANKRGTGKIRHLSSKLLWIQERTADGSLVVSQVSTTINVSDLGTKPLTAMRMKGLLFLLGFVDAENGQQIGQTEYEEMVDRSSSSKKVKQMANLMLRILAIGSLQGVDKLDLSREDMCYLIDEPYMDALATSWSLWTSSGLAVLACIGLAIIAVMMLALFFLFKMRREVEELKENLQVLRAEEIHGINCSMSRIDEEINTLAGRMLFQRNLAEVARLNGVSAANRAERRTEEAFQMFFRLWEGLINLGGYINSFEESMDEPERRGLFLRNSDLRDEDRRSRQDSPVSRDFEVENLDEADDTQYGAPRTSPEPEPHTVLNENLPPGYEPDNETQLPINPEEEMRGYADRLDQEIRDLREVQDEAAGVGDEVEAERVGQMINNLEGLLLHLPRPTRLR